jgi:hypothetical protein
MRHKRSSVRSPVRKLEFGDALTIDLVTAASRQHEPRPAF